MPTLRIPTPLRVYTNGDNEVQIIGATVADAMTDLVSQYPAIKPHLFKEDGDLRSFVNIFKGEDNVNDLQGLRTQVAEHDRLMIIPSIAGG